MQKVHFFGNEVAFCAFFRLAASLAAEEEANFNESELASAGDGPSVEEGDDDDEENEEMIFVSLV